MKKCQVWGGVVIAVKHDVYNSTPNLALFEFAVIMLAIRRSDVVQLGIARLHKARPTSCLTGWLRGWDPAGSEALGVLFDGQLVCFVGHQLGPWVFQNDRTGHS